MTLPTETWDRTSNYYSGQGVVLIGTRDANGRPRGLVPVGNVSELTLGLETTTVDHKESQSGQRAIDLRLTTEQNSSISMTMENFVAENLALALRANITEKAAGAVVDEEVKLWTGKVEPMANIKVSSVVITKNAATMTEYADDVTPWDYKVNTETGSLMWNDASDLAIANMADDGDAITAVSIAAQAVITVAAVPSYLEVGDYVVIDDTIIGTVGTPLELKRHLVVAVTSTTITIDTATTALAYTSGGKVEYDGGSFEATYSYEAQNLVDAFETGSLERYMRFEGLNTADSNNPVVIEVFRFQADPLAELAMISDEVGQFVIEGSALADPLQATGSQFFKITMVR